MHMLETLNRLREAHAEATSLLLQCFHAKRARRRDPSLPTPETSAEIEKMSTEWGHALMPARKFGPARDAKAKISHVLLKGAVRARPRRGSVPSSSATGDPMTNRLLNLYAYYY
jgi:hypothetical protein